MLSCIRGFKALTDVLDRLPEAPQVPLEQLRHQWQQWQEGPSVKVPLPEPLPSLRMLLVLDNLKGHKTPVFVRWMMEHGVMSLYTPIAGSWLNMAESIQRIIVRRALAGQRLTSPEQIIEELEATARGWNCQPTPFVWGGKRKAWRDRARSRRHALGGSGAYSNQAISRTRTPMANDPLVHRQPIRVGLFRRLRSHNPEEG